MIYNTGIFLFCQDLHRTGCSGFSGQENEEDRAVLKRVLLGYARWNKSIGYCQGFNVIAALLLEVMDRKEDDALKVIQSNSLSRTRQDCSKTFQDIWEFEISRVTYLKNKGFGLVNHSDIYIVFKIPVFALSKFNCTAKWILQLLKSVVPWNIMIYQSKWLVKQKVV